MKNSILEEIKKSCPELFGVQKKSQKMFFVKLLSSWVGIALITFLLVGSINKIEIVGIFIAILAPFLLNPFKCFGKPQIGVVEEVLFSEKRMAVKDFLIGFREPQTYSTTQGTSSKITGHHA